MKMSEMNSASSITPEPTQLFSQLLSIEVIMIIMQIAQHMQVSIWQFHQAGDSDFKLLTKLWAAQDFQIHNSNKLMLNHSICINFNKVK